MLPCTVLVDLELVTTLPANCWLGMASGIRSTKLVSVRLTPCLRVGDVARNVFQRNAAPASLTPPW